MKPDQRFLRQPQSFWANVRTISQANGYTVRGKKIVKVPTLLEMQKALQKVKLKSEHIVDEAGEATELGQLLLDYFQYRADALNDVVQHNLLNAEQAAALFAQVQAKYPKSQCPLPMNKQKGVKRAPAFLTGLVNLIVEANAAGNPCDYDPRVLTTVTRNDVPLRTLSRRVDGAFPRSVNPIAIWEIKEYYYTTTFGSRVADGVYETLLDGMELEELREHEDVDVKHYLIVDAHYTWWECGRSYLCRIIDMLHLGYVDEVLFGKEVVERLPELVREWVLQLDAD
ncbi:hypothetical protein N9B53_01170 [Mariniblastus sp.]|nr:hypothetical protein [Mariniblastus sp.]